MPFAAVALVSGGLSVLAPCVIGLLPILIGRSVGADNRVRNVGLVIIGLCVSIFTFSILLKATTLLIGVPQEVWQTVAGTILVLFGVVTLLPRLWDTVSARLRLAELGNRGAQYGAGRQSAVGDVVLGASLGPVFSACSPTYAVIVAVILPAEPLEGVVYLIAFLVGLAGMMLLAVLGGREMVARLGWGVNPHGWLKRIMGVLFIVIGVAIGTGLDKELLGWLVGNGWFDWQLDLEDQLN
ncbi:cytochrome c biogenesis CcdA family protein [Phytoactinopolyspora endophytica]|uniref:cytochrome c biogenesis CcdA family protein n=1 Tax=Phytoactinopolyspora endophytica TaxID=1642495 RepID=UPI00101C833B|nr:cytochrome c biogenesis protein CcdA [Phytoactinopolyspora endophytica]